MSETPSEPTIKGNVRRIDFHRQSNSLDAVEFAKLTTSTTTKRNTSTTVTDIASSTVAGLREFEEVLKKVSRKHSLPNKISSSSVDRGARGAGGGGGGVGGGGGGNGSGAGSGSRSGSGSGSGSASTSGSGSIKSHSNGSGSASAIQLTTGTLQECARNMTCHRHRLSY